MAGTIRESILKELDRRDWTIYRFAKELDGKVNIRVVYQYLSEGQDTGTEIASKMLEELGLSVGVINCRFVKPLDHKLAAYVQSAERLLIVEENIRQGGLGGAILELFNDLGVQKAHIRRLGLPDMFVEHGPVSVLKEKYGLDKMGIYKVAREMCSKE